MRQPNDTAGHYQQHTLQHKSREMPRGKQQTENRTIEKHRRGREAAAEAERQGDREAERQGDRVRARVLALRTRTFPAAVWPGAWRTADSPSAAADNAGNETKRLMARNAAKKGVNKNPTRAVATAAPR